MAVISKRKTQSGETHHQVAVRLKGHPPQFQTFARLTDARRWAQSTEAAMREGRFKAPESSKHTLTELIDRYLEDVLPSKKSERDQKRQLTWWKETIGYLTLDAVTPPVLVEARNDLAREANDNGDLRSPATVNRYCAAISHAFSVAVREWHWMEGNPMTKVSKAKEPRGRDRYLSDEERTELLKACEESGHPYLHTAVVVSLSTGARQAEILGLKWKDVELKSGKITLFDTKNGDVRPLPLRGKALELMRKLFRNRTVGLDWVFPGRPNRKSGIMGPIDLRPPWLEALAKAGIENFKWHDLRHSAASYLAMGGASLSEIAAVLGHRQLSMVQRYAHLSEQHTSGVVERMNERIFGGSNQ